MNPRRATQNSGSDHAWSATFNMVGEMATKAVTASTRPGDATCRRSSIQVRMTTPAKEAAFTTRAPVSSESPTQWPAASSAENPGANVVLDCPVRSE